MNKGARRNVYKLQGRPFVLVKGYRCFSQKLTDSNAKAGQRLQCSAPVEENGKLVVKVYTRVGKKTVAETFGGSLESEYVEVP